MGARDVAGQGFEDIERELEPVALFGVDREIEVGLGRPIDQATHARHELGEHAAALRLLIARKECRELDRNAVGVFRASAGAGFGDRTDRAGVRGQIAFRVALGARTLAQHVVAEAKRGHGFSRARGFAERFADRSAENELAAEQLDRPHRGGDDGLRTEAAQQPGVAFAIGQKALGERDRAGRQAGNQAVRRAGPLVARR